MTKTRIDILKENCSFNPSDPKYLIPGAEILKYIGQDVALLDFKKVDDKWSHEQKTARINDLYDFEPITMTYMCDYQEKSLSGEYDPEIKSIRIQPEGASYEDAEKTGEAKRFLPFSKRFEMMEDAMFFSRVAELWESRKTLSVESLMDISESKDQPIILRYSRNVCAAVVLEDNTLICFRIHKLKLKHKAGNSYFLRLENEDRYWNFPVTSDQEYYDFENGLGKLKIIDIMSDKPEVQSPIEDRKNE